MFRAKKKRSRSSKWLEMRPIRHCHLETARFRHPQKAVNQAASPTILFHSSPVGALALGESAKSVTLAEYIINEKSLINLDKSDRTIEFSKSSKPKGAAIIHPEAVSPSL